LLRLTCAAALCAACIPYTLWRCQVQLLIDVKTLSLPCGAVLHIKRVGLGALEGGTCGLVSEACAYFTVAGRDDEEVLLFWDEVDDLARLPRTIGVAVALDVAAACIDAAGPMHRAGRAADTVGEAQKVAEAGEVAVVLALLRKPVQSGLVTADELDEMPLPVGAIRALYAWARHAEQRTDSMGTDLTPLAIPSLQAYSLAPVYC